jgi:hypothetical protein
MSDEGAAMKRFWLAVPVLAAGVAACGDKSGG